MRSRNLPRDDPAKWELFIDYNKQDVVTESSVLAALDGLGTFIPGEGGDEWMQREHRFWAEIDHPINARGVPIDGAFVDGAIKMDGDYRAELEAKMTRMAGIENPNSAPQFKAWMLKETGVICDALNKETMPELLRTAPTDLVREMLQLREEIAQTASVKYHAARRAAGPDDRVRGLLQFNGAPRTGRWSGRLVQIHNMKKGVSPIFDALREAVKRGDRDFVDMWFGGVNTALGHLVRSIFAPAPGRVFVGGDWSAIEAVNLAWLADEKWRREVFATHGKLYEVSASKMFNVPWSEFQAYIDQKKKHPLRQKAKVAELALGFQGGPGAMITMGALDEGIPESELPGIVDAWRLASPRISNWDDGLWIRLQNAAIACVLSGRAIEVKVGPDNCSAVWFEIRRNKLGYKVLQMHLPCGRRLSYFDPQVAKDPKFGKSAVNYKGVNDKKQWNVIWSYGGKWTENLDQAMAASILREALDALRDDPAAFHVHDEIQLEESIERASALAARLKAVMERPLKWAPGLILKAETEILPYYRKTD
jgi:DNA polymerase